LWHLTMKQDTSAFILNIANKIQQVSGATAVVLGGSRARGTDSPDSDVDLGIYYHSKQPLDLDALNRLATELDDEHRSDLLTPIGGWGPWINGGGWLKIDGTAVDFLYRDLEKVSQVITDCRAGRLQVDYQPGHPHAFTSAIYLAEVALCQPLTDPHTAVKGLKQMVSPYPNALQQALVDRFFWEARFSIAIAGKAASRGDAAYVAGCMFRCTSCLLQTLFALNEHYWMNEKGALAIAAGFDRSPGDLKKRIHTAFGSLQPKATSLAAGLTILDTIIREVEDLLSSHPAKT
jgi:predicted nucleotidyltransferase